MQYPQSTKQQLSITQQSYSQRLITMFYVKIFVNVFMSPLLLRITSILCHVSFLRNGELVISLMDHFEYSMMAYNF